MFKQKLNEIDQAFCKNQIRFILLKGLSLAERYYPNPLTRSFGDLDILVEEWNFKKAEAILESMGGKRDNEDNKWDANSFKSVWLFEQSHVELHGKLLYDRARNPFDGLTRKTNIAGLNWCEDLSPEFNFVYLCGHHAFQHLFDELYWLVDLDLILRNESLDWEKVLRYAEELRLKNAVNTSLAILKAQFQTPIPDDLIEQNWKTFLIKKYVTPIRVLEYSHRSATYYYLFLKALLRDGLNEMMIYSFKRLIQRQFRIGL